MPKFYANNISYQFDNGDTLFDHLTFSMNQKRVGVVGRNGAGKSVLASIISGQIQPSSGSISKLHSCATYHQQAVSFGQQNIAEFLGQADLLDALNHIESGDVSQHWFDVVGDNWDAEPQLKRALIELNLPCDPFMDCNQLSGGQQARLQLWQLFSGDHELLILDEPSNHLDRRAKQWLKHSMHEFGGHILLISHDRELLREMDEIWELSSLGLRVYGGNYDDYHARKQAETQALDRQLNQVVKQTKHLEIQQQKNREKAEQRAAQGNKIRKDGSQPKMLLDGMKESAEDSVSNRNKNTTLRRNLLDQKQQALSSQLEQIKPQKFYLSQGSEQKHQVLNLESVVLPFGIQAPIALQVRANDKVHLTGLNGCGKSTLLKVVNGQYSPLSGQLQINCPVYYLDQHFSVVIHEQTLLDNLMNACVGLIESDARTLLAGIGFRSDKVFKLVQTLSGGEKMKLAMLIVSHQTEKPLLLLDEPDNHLDLESKILLASALSDYQGGFLLVSHDEDFALEAGIQRTLELE
ncbi:ABC-F family ATP-binding cassette domain-containing protein [Vibrio aquaticus]|uniref:ABC-F family ATP-binding cassette domain-containing protein n=1 Tax=Vibrio aquaticus TaxID=2496559 RepID=A0A432D191_9VIBR|nr:ATP-binding cassette domain-containing protein [Vibrio aquaticus]RTZ17694.1 ABC-F family ATP-binding cassette domain-containing protein [Vibrio aquaticus]